MTEVYMLTLTRYAVNSETGERIRLDEPLCLSYLSDGSPISLNRMFDEMKAYAIEKAERGEDQYHLPSVRLFCDDGR